MITAGIDCGARAAKAVILIEGTVAGKGTSLTGYDPGRAVDDSLDAAVKEAGIPREDIQKIGGTGSDKAVMNVADTRVTDAEALSKAARFFFPDARTVVDVGAEEARAVKLDQRGGIEDVAVNERCAAGAGTFLESMSRALDIPVEELGPLALTSERRIPMNAQCVVFAEAEVVGLIHAGTEKKDISKAIHDAMAGRIVSLIRRIGVHEGLVLMGGVARNPGLVEAVKRELNLEDLCIPEDPEYAAALGAALVAGETRESSKFDMGESSNRHVNESPGGIPSAPESRTGCEGGIPEWWTEMQSRWCASDVNWKDAEHVTVGIDVGSVSSQAVIMADGRIATYGNIRTGSGSSESARRVLDFAKEGLIGFSDERIDYLVGTGYGRVNVPTADRMVTEVACHARGAVFIYGPRVRTVLDVGGQDIKVIQCDERGKVTDFLMNDKCAAGTGRGMEAFADLLDIPIQEVGHRSFQVREDPRAVSGMCVVYAKMEAIQLLRDGWSVEEVLAAYCRATAERIHSLVEKSGVTPEFVITGGMAKNPGVVRRLMDMVGLEPMKGAWDPQIAGAAGAALFGHTLCLRGKRRKKR